MEFDRLLPVMGVGSYATPGWLFPFRQAMSDGRAGPDDIAEAFEDATRIVIGDQIEAGVDVVCDGELRRQRFVYEMYDRIDGLQRIPPGRRLGVSGYDRAPKFIATEQVSASEGLDLVAEYQALRRLAPDRRLKIAFPGPLTFARNISPGATYGDGPAAYRALMADIVTMLAAEVAALRAVGADFIQIDEPGMTNLPPETSEREAAEAINAVVAGHGGNCAVHVCFGNNASRPYARRDLVRLMPLMRQLEVAALMLEFANREMAELALLEDLSGPFLIAAGVIDVKSFHEETPEDVATRIRAVLRHAPAERLIVTADCGFSAIPRWLARQKLEAMTAGANLVRAEG